MKERMRTGETRLEIRKQIMEKIGHEKKIWEMEK